MEGLRRLRPGQKGLIPTMLCSPIRGRRFGRDRYGRDCPCSYKGRKNNGYFYKQCHLRNDIGQMAPTTLIDQVTTTTPFGRKPEVHGYPINVCELLSTLEGAVYVERVSVHDIKNIMNAKKAIKRHLKFRWQTWVSRLLKCCHPVRQTGD